MNKKHLTVAKALSDPATQQTLERTLNNLATLTKSIGTPTLFGVGRSNQLAILLASELVNLVKDGKLSEPETALTVLLDAQISAIATTIQEGCGSSIADNLGMADNILAEKFDEGDPLKSVDELSEFFGTAGHYQTWPHDLIPANFYGKSGLHTVFSNMLEGGDQCEAIEEIADSAMESIIYANFTDEGIRDYA